MNINRFACAIPLRPNLFGSGHSTLATEEMGIVFRESSLERLEDATRKLPPQAVPFAKAYRRDKEIKGLRTVPRVSFADTLQNASQFAMTSQDLLHNAGAALEELHWQANLIRDLYRDNADILWRNRWQPE